MYSEIIIIFLLIIINGVLSASEIAIVSSSSSKLKAASDRKYSGAQAVLDFKDNPNRFISTIQVGITLIGISIGYFSGGALTTHMADVLNNVGFLRPISAQLSVVLLILIVTYFSLVIGELVPKRIGLAIPEKTALVLVHPIHILGKIFRPFVWFLSVSTDFLIRLLNLKSTSSTVTEEEIKALVDEGVSSGVIESYEHDFWDRLLELGDKKAINLMVHRGDVIYLDVSQSMEDIKQVLTQYKHTEYPVCDESFDNVVGVVHLKSLFDYYLQGKEFELKNICQEVPFITENTSIYHALESIRESGAQIAIVVDEYGTPQGMVSAKEIINNLVGSFDLLEEDTIHKVVRREDGSFLIDGRYQLDDFFDYFQVNIEALEEINHITTIGGLVFAILDRMPVEGDTVVLGNLKLEVLDLDGYRIDKLAVYKKSKHKSV